MFYRSTRKALSYTCINTSATVIVGTWGKHLRDCRIALSNMFEQLTRPRRFQQHRWCKRNDTKPDCNSVFGQRLIENEQSGLNYNNKRFSILVAERSSFHLNLLEAAYIKTQRQVLCRQKEFVYTLKLFR